ncbi:MAG: OsmC family protein [Chitinophagales bacterium]|nr:OsmC family protein [Chitinophagales bacterium]MDW8418385.1 OsmC family protein [Chitinophagales bacterium]
MNTALVTYLGDLRTRITHIYSGTEVLSDAPLDNHGLAQSFSPTDYVAAALGSCMMTIMGIKARDMNIDLRGTVVEIRKIMAANPRRIGEIHVRVKFPVGSYTEKDKHILENAAKTCPVALSLHPEIKQEVSFIWP